MPAKLTLTAARRIRSATWPTGHKSWRRAGPATSATGQPSWRGNDSVTPTPERMPLRREHFRDARCWPGTPPRPRLGARGILPFTRQPRGPVSLVLIADLRVGVAAVHIV